jgi:hypothetical protein
MTTASPPKQQGGEAAIVDAGVAPVTPSNRGQHRHQRRCRRRWLERVDRPSYQGRLGAPPTISRRQSCRGQMLEVGGPEPSSTASASTSRASARVSCGARRRGAGTNSGGAEQAGSRWRAAAPKLTGSRPGATAAGRQHWARKENERTRRACRWEREREWEERRGRAVVVDPVRLDHGPAYWAKWARSSPGFVNWPNSFFY